MKNYYFTSLISLSTLMIGFLLGYIFLGGLFNTPSVNQQVMAAANDADEIDSDISVHRLTGKSDNNLQDIAEIESTANTSEAALSEINEQEQYQYQSQYLEQEQLQDNGIRITKDTKIVYEYYYLYDGVTETAEEQPPLFLIDKTEIELKNSLDGWSVIQFMADEVIVRKEIDGKSSQYYVVGIYDGHVAVFYDDEQLLGLSLQEYQQHYNDVASIKEITDMPVGALTDNEINRLEQGIRVTGDEALFRILEDYGS